MTPSGYFTLIYRFFFYLFQRCVHCIKALAAFVFATDQLVPQLKEKETALLLCKHNIVDIFWVLFSTALFKQDPTCPGDCTQPRGANCCCPGSAGARSVWEKKKKKRTGHNDVLCLTSVFSREDIGIWGIWESGGGHSVWTLQRWLGHDGGGENA